MAEEFKNKPERFAAADNLTTEKAGPLGLPVAAADNLTTEKAGPLGLPGEAASRTPPLVKRRRWGLVVTLVACLALVLVLCSGAGLAAVLFAGSLFVCVGPQNSSAGQIVTDKPADKMREYIAWSWDQQMRLIAVNQSGNRNAVAHAQADFESGQKSWMWKPISGTAAVDKVLMNQVYLSLSDERRRKWTILAFAKDEHDPLLGKLARGDVLEYEGVLAPCDLYATFEVKDCTFTLKQ